MSHVHSLSDVLTLRLGAHVWLDALRLGIRCQQSYCGGRRMWRGLPSRQASAGLLDVPRVRRRTVPGVHERSPITVEAEQIRGAERRARSTARRDRGAARISETARHRRGCRPPQRSSVIFTMASISTSSRSQSICSSLGQAAGLRSRGGRDASRGDGSRRPAGARRDGAACAAHLPADARGGRPGRAAALGRCGCRRPCLRRRRRRLGLPPGSRHDGLPVLAGHARAREPRDTGDDQRARGRGRSRLRGHRACSRLGCGPRPGAGPSRGPRRPADDQVGARRRALAPPARCRSRDDASCSPRGRGRRP